jgi:mono/diheme cytochrome c family protein
MRCTVLCLGFLPFICAAELQIEASRGPAVLKEQGCTNCHAIGSQGSTVSAAALGRTLNREYSPAGLTATLWNHAPQMWSEMGAKGVQVPKVSEQEAANLFGYFGSLRYFEPMGEASRGARLFRSKNCTGCHAITGQGGGAALPVSQWQSVTLSCRGRNGHGGSFSYPFGAPF